MKIIDCDQRSADWHAIRLGKLTGSRVGDAFATIKSGGEAAARRNYRVQLVLERLTGRSQENGYVSADMERGIALESDARAAYEATCGTFVEPIGFVLHDDLQTGCSPDGVVFGDSGILGLIEIKCPKAATHLDHVRRQLPREYVDQVRHGLWLTGAEWADFVSFHPDFPESLRLAVTRLTLSEVERKAHEICVRAFLTDVDREVDAVKALMASAVAV